MRYCDFMVDFINNSLLLCTEGSSWKLIRIIYYMQKFFQNSELLRGTYEQVLSLWESFQLCDPFSLKPQKEF